MPIAVGIVLGGLIPSVEEDGAGRGVPDGRRLGQDFLHAVVGREGLALLNADRPRNFRALGDVLRSLDANPAQILESVGLEPNLFDNLQWSRPAGRLLRAENGAIPDCKLLTSVDTAMLHDFVNRTSAEPFDGAQDLVQGRHRSGFLSYCNH